MKTIVITVAEYDECSEGLMIPSCQFFTGSEKQTPEEEAAEWLLDDIKDTLHNMITQEGEDLDEYVEDMNGNVKAEDITDEAEWDTPSDFDNHWVKWKVFIKD